MRHARARTLRHLAFRQEKAGRSVGFSIDLNRLSESTWPIVFAGTPIFGNLSVWVQPAASVWVMHKVTLRFANRSLLKSEERDEMLRAAFIDVQMSVSTNEGDLIEPRGAGVFIEA